MSKKEVLEIRAASIQEMDLVRKLFREYEAWLEVDLCFQGFEEELATLPGLYQPPQGGLWLADAGPKIAGAIGLRPQAPGVAELKRLWVRPGYRGSGLGRLLCQTAIEGARQAGYRAIRLDTLSDKMAEAQILYERLGFTEIPAYYDNPYPHVRFLQLDL